MQGGGPANTECLAAWYLPGTPFIKAGAKVQVLCKPGESCDADGSATDAVCTFRVAVCLNSTDPTLQCQPGPLASFKLMRPNPASPRLSGSDSANANAILKAVSSLQVGATIAPDSALQFNPALTAINTCSGLFDVLVPLKANANGTLSKRTIKLRSLVKTLPSPGMPKRVKDSDTLRLVCYPP